jgi:hypothetical protein
MFYLAMWLVGSVALGLALASITLIRELWRDQRARVRSRSWERPAEAPLDARPQPNRIAS